MGFPWWEGPAGRSGHADGRAGTFAIKSVKWKGLENGWVGQCPESTLVYYCDSEDSPDSSLQRSDMATNTIESRI